MTSWTLVSCPCDNGVPLKTVDDEGDNKELANSSKSDVKIISGVLIKKDNYNIIPSMYSMLNLLRYDIGTVLESSL